MNLKPFRIVKEMFKKPEPFLGDSVQGTSSPPKYQNTSSKLCFVFALLVDLHLTSLCVFNNLKKIAHYDNNGFEEDIYI